MLNRFHVLTAACVAVSAGLFVAQAPAADNDSTTITKSSTSVTYTPNSGESAALPAGITPKNLNDDKAIEKAFKKVTDDALSRNSFDNIVSMLSDQDKDRIKQSAGNASLTNLDGNKNKQLNDLADRLDDLWKQKFNHKFSVDYKKTYTPDFLQIQTGEVADPNALIGKWPVDAGGMSSLSSGGKVTAEDAKIAQDKAFGGRVNLEKGRDVAVGHLVASHGMEGLNVSMLHETMSGWKFDIPNTITAQKLYDNLVANLSYIDQHRDQLPANAEDAYREVTHAVVAALYDVNLSGGTAQNAMPGAVRPANAADNR